MITRPRRHVSTLLYIRLPILVLELTWTIYSTVAVFESYIDHKNSSMPLVAGLYENFTADSCQFSTVIKVGSFEIPFLAPSPKAGKVADIGKKSHVKCLLSKNSEIFQNSQQNLE